MSSMRSFRCSFRFLRVDFFDLFGFGEVGLGSRVRAGDLQVRGAWRRVVELLVGLQQQFLELCDCAFMLRLLGRGFGNGKPVDA